MKIKLILGFALVLCVAGCTTVTMISLHCTPLSREDQGLIFANLNRMLISNGFTVSPPSQDPSGIDWQNGALSPLWQGNADFGIGTITNSTDMDIYIFYYRGRLSANKAVVGAVMSCVQSNAPNAQVKIKTSTELVPAIPFKQ